MEKNKIFNSDNIEIMQKMESECLDVILIDPPYLYLKNQKLERKFDENLFFSECKRLLKNSGFIVMFGRGTSFYRWNTILGDLGFIFKEEIVWDKCRTSSPVNPIARKHELISIHSKKKASINKVRVQFINKYKHEPEKIKETINRIASALGNRKTFELLRKYYDSGHKEYNQSVDGFCVTRSKGSTKSLNRTVDFAVALEEGVTEQSIIKEAADHYASIHPTQKPVRLLERLLALVSKEGDFVADFFAGSMSTVEACINTNRNYLATEIDKEYFYLGDARIRNLKNNKGKTIKIPF